MNAKTDTTSKPRAAKTRSRKAAPQATARKKAADKTPRKSVLDQFGDTVIVPPLKVASKTFMASLGLLSYMQTEIEKQYKEFDRKFDKYARDGEVVLDQFENRVGDFRKDVEKRVEEVRGRVRDTFEKAA